MKHTCTVPCIIHVLIVSSEKSYYKTRNVCMFVCPQSPPPFTDRPAPDLAGIGGWGQVQNPA